MAAFYRVPPGFINLFMRAAPAGLAVQITTTNLHQYRNARQILGGLGAAFFRRIPQINPV
jgi:hypothetical protein